MTRVAATYFASCSAVVVASLVYVVPAFRAVPLLWYYPTARSWALETQPTELGLDWYGRTLWSLLAAAATFAVVRLLAARMSAPRPRAYRVWAVWVGMTSVLAIAVYTYQLAYREPIPEPLPAWHAPR